MATFRALSAIKIRPYVGFHVLSARFSGVAARSVIERVGVVGGGQMGMGIAVTAALRGKKMVTVVDSNMSALEKSLAFSQKWLDGQVKKEKITCEDRDGTLSRLVLSSDIKSLVDADFVVEAVPENEQIKKEIFTELSSTTAEDVILATNTSSIPITRIAAWTGSRAERVCGMHFMNPVPIMKLVEVIPGLATSDDTKSIVVQLAEDMGKTTTESRDEVGFIANRILMPYINEAVMVLQDGIATKEDIDKTMKLGTNVPMGPLTLADFIGLDTCLFIMQTLHESLGDSKYRPATLLHRYVEAGWLGKKSGKGFYDYPPK